MNDNHPETLPETLARIARLRRGARQELLSPELSREARWEIRRCIRLLDLAERNIRRGGVRVIASADSPPRLNTAWWITRESLAAAFETDPIAD